MPTYTIDSNSDADKLPTVRQWINQVSKEALEPVRIVKVIWCPNLFPNYSLDTEVYRVRVSPDQALFQVLEDNLEDWVENDVVLAIQIEGSKKPKLSLMTLDGEQCEWDALGEHGFKMSNLTAKKPPKTKPRSNKATSPDQTAPSEPLQGASE